MYKPFNSSKIQQTGDRIDIGKRCFISIIAGGEKNKSVEKSVEIVDNFKNFYKE